MAHVRNKNTGPELRLRRALWAAHVRGWRCHPAKVTGRPDLAFTRWKLAVFVDGAFWHGHPSHYRPGQSGAFWDRKIERNRARDRQVTEALEAAGWVVLRFWDFDVERDATRVADQIQRVLASLKEGIAR